MVIFLLFLILACGTLYCARGNNIVKVINVVSIGFALLAFFQLVNPESDLTTAFHHLNNIRNQGWSYFEDLSQSSVYFTGRFSLQMYFYLLSFLPFNNFYSAISMLIVYWCMLMAVHDASRYFGIRLYHEKLLLILVIFLTDFYDCSNGVRNILAFAIFIYAFIEDQTKNKNRYLCWGIYIVALFIHTATWPLLVFRILLVVKYRWLKMLIGTVTILWSNGLESLANLLSLFNSIPMVQGLIHGLIAYTEGTGSNYTESAFNMSASYMMMKNFRIYLTIILLLIAIVVWRKYKNLSPIMTYGFYLITFTLGANVSGLATNIITRYSFALILIAPILYGEYCTLKVPKMKLVLGRIKIEIIALLFVICAILFNYYMFRYHYTALGFSLELL